MPAQVSVEDICILTSCSLVKPGFTHNYIMSMQRAVVLLACVVFPCGLFVTDLCLNLAINVTLVTQGVVKTRG